MERASASVQCCVVFTESTADKSRTRPFENVRLIKSSEVTISLFLRVRTRSALSSSTTCSCTSMATPVLA